MNKLQSLLKSEVKKSNDKKFKNKDKSDINPNVTLDLKCDVPGSFETLSTKQKLDRKIDFTNPDLNPDETYLKINCNATFTEKAKPLENCTIDVKTVDNNDKIPINIDANSTFVANDKLSMPKNCNINRTFTESNKLINEECNSTFSKPPEIEHNSTFTAPIKLAEKKNPNETILLDIEKDTKVSARLNATYDEKDVKGPARLNTTYVEEKNTKVIKTDKVLDGTFDNHQPNEIVMDATFSKHDDNKNKDNCNTTYTESKPMDVWSKVEANISLSEEELLKLKIPKRKSFCLDNSSAKLDLTFDQNDRLNLSKGCEKQTPNSSLYLNSFCEDNNLNGTFVQTYKNDVTFEKQDASFLVKDIDIMDADADALGKILQGTPDRRTSTPVQDNNKRMSIVAKVGIPSKISEVPEPKFKQIKTQGNYNFYYSLFISYNVM